MQPLLSADEFIKKIMKGESVKNSIINGDVIIANTKIIQTDWSNCRFDSSIQISGCIFEVKKYKCRGPYQENGKTVARTNRFFEALCLKSSEINGSLIISNCIINCYVISPEKPRRPSYHQRSYIDQTNRVKNIACDYHDINLKHAIVHKRLEISFIKTITAEYYSARPPLLSFYRMNLIYAESYRKNKIDRIVLETEVDAYIPIFRINFKKAKISSLVLQMHQEKIGSLVLQNHQDKIQNFVEAEGTTVSGIFEIIGDFHRINIDASIIQSDLMIELDGSEVLKDISLVRSKINGDFACLASDNHVEIVRKHLYQEVDDDGNANYYNVVIDNLKLFKVKVEGDCYIGFRKYDLIDFEDSKLNFNSLNIINCNVLGEIVLDRIMVSGKDWGSCYTKEASDSEEDIYGNINAAICIDKTYAKSAFINNIKVDKSKLKKLTGISLNSSDISQIDLNKIIIRFEQCLNAAKDKRSIIAIDAANLVCKTISIKEVESERKYKHLGDIDIVNESPILNFDSAVISLLSIKQKSSNLIQNAAIGTWKLDPPNETAENYIQMLDSSKEIQSLDLNQCIKIEKHLENIGKKAEADKIHFYWRREAQKMLWPNDRFKYLISLVWDKSIKYGLSPLRPLFVLFPAILISSILFSNNYSSWVRISPESLSTLNQCGADCLEYKNQMILDSQERKNQIINSILLSVSSSTPIIDIGTVKHLDAIPKTRGYWIILILKILGWVVWPLFLTGVVPLILPKRQ